MLEHLRDVLTALANDIDFRKLVGSTCKFLPKTIAFEGLRSTGGAGWTHWLVNARVGNPAVLRDAGLIGGGCACRVYTPTSVRDV